MDFSTWPRPSDHIAGWSCA